MIPTNITQENILKSIGYLSKNGIREEYQSKDYDLYFKKRRYPPKDVLRIANKYQTGVELSDFKGGERNANHYLRGRGFLVIKKHSSISSEFFNQAELKRFNKLARVTYNKNSVEHKIELDYIYSTLYNKTNFWAEQICPKNFIIKRDTWPFLNDYRQMVFKPYTWARIFREKDENKFIFFTVGVDAKDMTLVYKLDCQWNDKRRFLDNIQVEKFRDRINGSPVKRVEIKISDLKNYDWDKLISITKKFINDYTKLYDDIIKYVWDDRIKTTGMANTLILREPPSVQKFKSKSKKRKQSEIDYNKRNKENKRLGEFGEKMVKLYEINSLKIANRPDLIGKVDKVKDGEGYDIISYDKFGMEKYIEVKTTKGNNLTNFPISANEYNFLKNNSRNAFIYRVYNAKPKKKFAEYFIMDDKKLHELFVCEDLSYIMKKK